MAQLQLDAADLAPLIDQVVTAAVEKLATVDKQLPPAQIAWPEAEAAGLLGVARHVLRDARLAGEIQHGLAGKRIVYTREQLVKYVLRRRK